MIKNIGIKILSKAKKNENKSNVLNAMNSEVCILKIQIKKFNLNWKFKFLYSKNKQIKIINTSKIIKQTDNPSNPKDKSRSKKEFFTQIYFVIYWNSNLFAEK